MTRSCLNLRRSSPLFVQYQQQYPPVLMESFPAQSTLSSFLPVQLELLFCTLVAVPVRALAYQHYLQGQVFARRRPWSWRYQQLDRPCQPFVRLMNQRQASRHDPVGSCVVDHVLFVCHSPDHAHASPQVIPLWDTSQVVLDPVFYILAISSMNHFSISLQRSSLVFTLFFTHFLVAPFFTIFIIFFFIIFYYFFPLQPFFINASCALRYQECSITNSRKL